MAELVRRNSISTHCRMLWIPMSLLLHDLTLSLTHSPQDKPWLAGCYSQWWVAHRDIHPSQYRYCIPFHCQSSALDTAWNNKYNVVIVVVCLFVCLLLTYKAGEFSQCMVVAVLHLLAVVDASSARIRELAPCGAVLYIPWVTWTTPVWAESVLTLAQLMTASVGCSSAFIYVCAYLWGKWNLLFDKVLLLMCHW